MKKSCKVCGKRKTNTTICEKCFDRIQILKIKRSSQQEGDDDE